MLQKQDIRSEDIYRFLIKVKSGAGEMAQWVKCEYAEHSADKQHLCKCWTGVVPTWKSNAWEAETEILEPATYLD